MVPMNVRSASEKLALGNKISSLFIDLPVCEPDPVRRYRETAARSAALKSDGHSAAGTTAVLDIAGLAPPVIHSTIAQALYATRLFNVTITNVPGPQQTAVRIRAPAARDPARWCRSRPRTQSGWRSSATTATRSSAWSPTATRCPTST